MGLIKLLIAPIRRVMSFPLFQLGIAVAVIMFLQAADSGSIFGEIFSALDGLVDVTVKLCAATFEAKSFTKAWLTTGFMIGYVYVAGLVILFAAKLLIRGAVELVARGNVFFLKNAIARERGIVAYRAWLPLERIRPASISQARWEERFAWAADGSPPYPPFVHRMVRTVVIYLVAGLIIGAVLQTFTPFPVLTWLGQATSALAARGLAAVKWGQ
jgi:hypothetical protein